MKIKLKQENLINMLEKLMVDNMFPSCIITIKDKTIFSIQREEHGRALRFAKFKEKYFDFISDENETIHINAEKFLNIIKKIPATTEINLIKEKDKIVIKGEYDGRKVEPRLSYLEPEDVIEKLEDVNLQMKDGILHFGKKDQEKIALDTKLSIEMQDIKDIVDYASAIDTEFYKFSLKDNIIKVNVGDLYGNSDVIEFYPKGKVIKGNILETVFTYGIPQVSKTFGKEINIHTKSNCPAWIYENTDEYVLGVFIPPYTQEEE